MIRVALTKALFDADKRISALRASLKSRIAPGTFMYRILRGPSMALRRVTGRSRELTGTGIFCREEELEFCSLFPKATLDFVVTTLKPRSVLDVGCGTGISLGYFVEHGVNARGIEGSKLAAGKSKYSNRIEIKNLERPIELNDRFDLVWTFEVAEHLHPEYAEEFVRTLTRHGDVVVLSAARPGQGGEGHFNEQEPEYWVGQFQKFSFDLDEPLTAQIRALGEPFSQNMLVMRRMTKTRP